MGTAYAVIGGPILTAIVTWFLTRRQNKSAVNLSDAQAAREIQEASLALLAPLREQVDGLITEVTTLRAQVHTLSDELDRERRDRARAEAVLERHGLTID